MDLNIDPKDVLELAAQKVASAILAEHDDLYETVTNRIEAFVNSVVTDEVRQSMVETIDAKMAEETEKVLAAEIVPLNIWGEAKGEPTTLRDQIHKRALEYWEEKVERDRNNTGRYKPSSYGGTPRHKLVFQDVAQIAFEDAMKANVTEMVRAFRDAMRKDVAAVAVKHIDSIINGRVLGDK